MSKKKKIDQEIAEANEPIVLEEPANETDLQASLEEIEKYDGVIGYIIRNNTSASINLKDSERITDYAILSSSTFDAISDLSEIYDIGKIKNITVKGNKVKILSMIAGENKISVFLEKDADAYKVIRKIQIV